MTITVSVPDELAEQAAAQGLSWKPTFNRLPAKQPGIAEPGCRADELPPKPWLISARSAKA